MLPDLNYFYGMYKVIIALFCCLALIVAARAQALTGADRTEVYLSLPSDKRVVLPGYRTATSQAYDLYPEKGNFFTPFFDKPAGNTTLQQQIKQGPSEAEIRDTREPALTQFKIIRKK